MLNESARTNYLLNPAHLREVVALYGPEEAKKVAAVFKTISLLSSFSASADTLNALEVSLARKNLHGNSGAQILAMTSNEFATLTVGAVSKDEKRRLKLALNNIVAATCDLQSDVYPMWLAAREMRKIDAAASQGDLLRALHDAKGDVDARIVDALVTNEFTRHFIIRLLRIDDKARDAESVAEALKAAVAGFIAGLPHFFEAAAVPEVLTAAPVALAAVTGGLPAVPAVSEAAAHPPVTAAAPTSAAAAPRRSRAPAQPPITAAAPTSAAAVISAQPPERNVRAEVLTMFDTLNSTLLSNQEQLNTTLVGLIDKLDTNGAAVQGSIASSTSLMLVALESAKKEMVDAVESGRSAVLSAIDAMAQTAHLDREAAHLDREAARDSARLEREAARDSARLERESNTANLMLAIHALHSAAHGPSAASASRANTQPTTPRQAAGVCTFARPTQCACRQAAND
jgi:hypothetical protein